MSEDFNGQLHVLVNETPVFGSKGQPISGALGSLHIELSSGLNTIRLFAEDEAGNKTRSQTVSYFRSQIKRKPDLYIVSVGVSKYQHQELNLDYARKDAEDMLSLFQNSQAFNKVNNLSLHDENVTRESMEQVKQFVSQAKADDRLVVFFAGHGFLDKQEKYYFAAHDVTPDNPEVRGISYQTISDVIDASPSRYKLLMLDTCHSGEVNAFASSNTSKLAEGVVSRGFKVKARKPTQQDGLNQSYQKLQTAFVDLRASTGAVVISASGGYEFALEKSNIGNGVFTSAVIKGLSDQAADLNNDGIIQTSELREFTYSEVKRLTDGQQQPTTRSYNLDTDFALY
nr:caspase family protein [Vibrio sp. 99-70-13A1]